MQHTCSTLNHFVEVHFYSLLQKYATKAGLPSLQKVTVLGLLFRPSVVELDGTSIKFTVTEGSPYNLVAEGLSINMDREFYLRWQQ